MVDIAKLRVVIDKVREWVKGESRRPTPTETLAIGSLLAAASELLALKENGQTVEWCEEHQASAPPHDGPEAFHRCYEWWIGEMNPESPPVSECRMVKASLHIHREGT